MDKEDVIIVADSDRDRIVKVCLIPAIRVSEMRLPDATELRLSSAMCVDESGCLLYIGERTDGGKICQFEISTLNETGVQLSDTSVDHELPASVA